MRPSNVTRALINSHASVVSAAMALAFTSPGSSSAPAGGSCPAPCGRTFPAPAQEVASDARAIAACGRS
eukprot:1489555-Pyramimonas_sp.AAC.1